MLMFFTLLVDLTSCTMKGRCPPQGPNSVDDAGMDSNSVEGRSEDVDSGEPIVEPLIWGD